MKTLCIYHSRDLDGWMSAAIVKKWFIENHKTIDSSIKSFKDRFNYPNPYLIQGYDYLDMFGYDYGDEVPRDYILTKYNTVIMVDVSFSGLEMINTHEQFKMLNKEFIYIDHHISSINDIKLKSRNGNNPIEGLTNTNFAACELTWKHLMQGMSGDADKESTTNTMPEMVRLLGMYDSFRHKGTDEEQKVLKFQYGARSIISNYNEAYKYLIDYLSTYSSNNTTLGSINYINNLLGLGNVIYSYLKAEAKQIYNKAFKFNIYSKVKYNDITSGYDYQPYKFLAVNAERFNPINFGIDYHKDGYEGFANFWFKNGKWNWSLYNDNGNIDCSLIAKQYGGGGHKGAAGFVQTNDEFIKFLNV